MLLDLWPLFDSEGEAEVGCAHMDLADGDVATLVLTGDGAALELARDTATLEFETC